MKTYGIIRNLDALGRISVPREICRTMDIQPGDPIEITPCGDAISLKPLKIQCVVCGDTNEEKHIIHKGIHFCPVCLAGIMRENK